jgi:uncharacterized Tic20 family protein
MATEPGDEPERDEDADGETDAETGGETSSETGTEAEAETETDLGYEVSSDDRTWGVLTHASAFSGLFVPFGNILGPLIVWLIKKEESQFVDENGKQALNFQITWTILLLVAGLSIFLGIGLLLVPVIGLVWLILVVIATVRASEETVYDYPLTIDLIS